MMPGILFAIALFDGIKKGVFARYRVGDDRADLQRYGAIMDYLQAETKEFLATNPMQRFHLGCGSTFLKDWLNIGYWDHLEQGRLFANPNQVEGTVLLNHDLRHGIPAPDGTLDAVYHSHMLEHLTYSDGLIFLQRIYQSLKPGGVHRIVVPNLEAFATAYLNGDKTMLLKKYQEVAFKDQPQYQTKASIFMGMLYNHGHLFCYDWETLAWALESIGFREVTRTLFQESTLLKDIETIEAYNPLRGLESLCVECVK